MSEVVAALALPSIVQMRRGAGRRGLDKRTLARSEINRKGMSCVLCVIPEFGELQS